MIDKKMKSNELIERDVHCPFCEKDKAILFSKTTSKSVSLQYPAYGLKFLISVVYLAIIHIIINGFKIMELAIKYNDVTYVFCPECGNSCSMEPSQDIKEEAEGNKFYKVRTDKKVMGVCTGISEYTGISLIWVRMITFIHCIFLWGFFVYIILGICTQFKEDVESGTNKKLHKIQDKKVFFGVCTGISDYAEVKLWVVRLFGVLMFVFYFILALCMSKDDDYGKK